MSVKESLEEMKHFLEALSIHRDAKAIISSDHASNYLMLKGRLGRDRLLAELDSLLSGDDGKPRPEWARGHNFAL